MKILVTGGAGFIGSAIIAALNNRGITDIVKLSEHAAELRKRGISTSDMAPRLFVSRDTLWRLERGDPAVALGTFATAAFILQLHDRLANLAAPASDELALHLDERRLPQRIHRPRP